MNAVRFKLSVMMFLQFFIWGAWFELGFDYIPNLGFEEWQLTLIFGAFNVGALVALFFSTQFADRTFAAERFLAFSQLVAGLAILGLFFLRGDKDNPAPFWPFFGLMLVHSLFYVPTISITNSIAFANLKDPQHDFGPVRVWGTIGWIAASWPFIFILVNWAKVPALADVGFIDWIGKALGTSKEGADASEAQRYIFLVAGVAALVLAAFSLTLPHTPPRPAAGAESLAWLKAARLLRHPFVLVLFVVTFIDAAVHQSYFFWTASFLSDRVGIPKNWVPPVMKISQVAEILTMLALGYVLKQLGWRATMVFGVLGHAARFAVFAYLPEQVPAIVINVVHGVCYAFFFATVYIFVDEFFPKDVRSSAQGLFNVLILGMGPFVANFLCGRLKTAYTTDNVLDYTAVFQYSMGAALVGAVLLALLFHPHKPAEAPGFSQAEADAPPAP
jgi:nucleoside transporter